MAFPSVRPERGQTEVEVTSFGAFDKDDLCIAWDQLAADRQEIERLLYRDYVARQSQALLLIGED